MQRFISWLINALCVPSFVLPCPVTRFYDRRILPLPTPTDLSTRLPRAQSASAALAHCARWVKDFLARDAPARAVRMSASFPGAQAAFAAVPAHKWRMEPANFLVAME